MRPLLVIALFAGCRREAADAIVARGWHAHELAIAAGEHAHTCAEAGAAMQIVIAEHRRDFADAIALERDDDRLEQAADYMNAHADDYLALYQRMSALEDRCADEPAVATAFAQMQ